MNKIHCQLIYKNKCSKECYKNSFYIDKFIKLKETDTMFIAIPVYVGKEKIYYEMLDNISKTGSNVITLSPKNNLSLHASQEDLMLMLNLMKPKYYFPIKGEYRFQVDNGELAYKLGIPKENILLKQNGDVVSITDGKLDNKFDHINCEPILIDGDMPDDIGEIVLKDRELLKDNGIVIVSVTLNKVNKKILAGPEILTRGFIYVKENIDIIKEAEKISLEVINDNIKNNYVEFNKIKLGIREKLGKYLYKETECKPMILIVMNEV